jgi:autotransporter-associated beta strand protein
VFLSSGNVTLASTASGDISFASTIDAASTSSLVSLAVNTAGTTSFDGAVGVTNKLNSLSTDAPGSTVIAGPGVTTSNSQTYSDPVRLGFDTALTASGFATIRFGATLDGAHALVLETLNNVIFMGLVGATTPLTRLSIIHSSTLISGGGITTAGAQNYRDVFLNADAVLSSVGAGPNDIMVSTIDGAHALTLSAGTGNVTFVGAVGAGSSLTALTISSANNVTAAAITAGAISQLAGIGTSTFGGPLHATTSAAGITLNGHNLVLAAATLDRGSLTITDSGAATISGAITAPGGGLTKAGPGTLGLTGANSYTGLTSVTGGQLAFDHSEPLPGGLHVGAGATALVGAAGDRVLTISSLSFDGPAATPQGRLDLTNNQLVINFGNTPDPIATITAQIAAGFNQGDWHGQGIISSSAAADPARFALGDADGFDSVVPGLVPGNLMVKFARKGDVNLDGTVSFPDLLALAQHFGQTNANWDQGDMNYDRAVAFPDLLALAQNFGGTLAANASPTTAIKSSRTLRVAATRRLVTPG